MGNIALDLPRELENFAPAIGHNSLNSFFSYPKDQQGPIPWPSPLTEEALYGLPGEIVRTIEPHTEADPAALLGQLLIAFGNVIGPGPHFSVEDQRHGMNLFVAIVGTTSKGRKGTSWGRILKPLQSIDSEWAGDRIADGLSSGEGLIWSVRDEIKNYQNVIIGEGVKDKRLLIVQGELGSALRVMGREGNTLSPTVRSAWDSGNLQTLTKNAPAKATGAHISIIGHITRDELRRYLHGTEVANGFANRFIYLCAKRSKVLPEGGNLSDGDLLSIGEKLREAVEFARSVTEIRLDDGAREIWREAYPELSEGKEGILGAVTSRAEAQVRRISCIYALMDRSAFVCEPHLSAALALWNYAEASAKFIFGDALCDSLADEILGKMRIHPLGLSRTEISNILGRNRRAQEIDRALRVLEERALAWKHVEKGQGRPAERWFATNMNMSTN